MTQENLHKTNFDHRQWIKFISEALENAQEFLTEVAETCKYFLKKGMKQGIEEVKFFISKSTPMDFICGGYLHQ